MEHAVLRFFNNILLKSNLAFGGLLLNGGNLFFVCFFPFLASTLECTLCLSDLPDPEYISVDSKASQQVLKKMAPDLAFLCLTEEELCCITMLPGL